MVKGLYSDLRPVVLVSPRIRCLPERGCGHGDVHRVVRGGAGGGGAGGQYRLCDAGPGSLLRGDRSPGHRGHEQEDCQHQGQGDNIVHSVKCSGQNIRENCC